MNKETYRLYPISSPMTSTNLANMVSVEKFFGESFCSKHDLLSLYFFPMGLFKKKTKKKLLPLLFFTSAFSSEDLQTSS